MSDKPRFPRADALAVARELCAALKPVTERLVVAGSLRRGRTDVGDVEILFIPSFEDRQLDMFTTAPHNLAEEEIGLMLSRGILTKRLSATGSAARPLPELRKIWDVATVSVTSRAPANSRYRKLGVCSQENKCSTSSS